jgi:hypothetical protein
MFNDCDASQLFMTRDQMVSGVYPVIAPNVAELFNARIRLRIVFAQGVSKSSRHKNGKEEELTKQSHSNVPQASALHDPASSFRRESVSFDSIKFQAQSVVNGRHYSVCVEQASQLQLSQASLRSYHPFRVTLLDAHRSDQSVVLVAFSSAGKQAPNCTSFVPASSSPMWKFWYVCRIGLA